MDGLFQDIKGTKLTKPGFIILNYYCAK